MVDDDGPLNDLEDNREFLERLDYHEIRIAARFDRLEERVRDLEREIRGMKDSGDADIRRIKNLFTRVFSGATETDDTVGDSATQKRFPITMKQTTIGLGILSGLVAIIRSSNDAVGNVEILGRWFGVFLFCAGVPALVAYLVAGRKEQWSRNDKWFFWGSSITSLWTIVLTLQNMM